MITFSSIIGWIMTIVGSAKWLITAAVGIVALYAMPVVREIMGFTKMALEHFRKGTEDIIDNGSTIFTVLALCLMSFLYGQYSKPCPSKEQAIKELRKDYKFIRR